MSDYRNEKEISVQICTGTTCYVMGASDLLTLEDYIPARLRRTVKISGSTCLGICKETGLKPPFVRIRGKLIARATIEKILEAVRAENEDTDYAYDE